MGGQKRKINQNYDTIENFGLNSDILSFLTLYSVLSVSGKTLVQLMPGHFLSESNSRGTSY